MTELEQEQWDALAWRCEAWKALAEAREEQVIWYREGREPPGKLLDRVARLKRELGVGQ